MIHKCFTRTGCPCWWEKTTCYNSDVCYSLTKIKSDWDQSQRCLGHWLVSSTWNSRQD